jgi:hypothetical protein
MEIPQVLQKNPSTHAPTKQLELRFAKAFVHMLCIKSSPEELAA